MTTHEAVDHRHEHEPPASVSASPGPTIGGRRRTRRACDACSSLRARCDGRQPCRRCEEYSRSCNYARHVAKRGRKPGNGISKGVADAGQNGQNGCANINGNEHEHQYSSVPLNSQNGHGHANSADISITTTTNADPYYWYREAPSPQVVVPSPHSPHPSSHQSPHAQGPSPQSTVGVVSPSNHRVSFSTQRPPQSSLSRPPRSRSRPRFTCLEPLLPRLDRIIDADLASELLQLYFVEPGGSLSLFQCASPYILTRVLRRESVLRPTSPRKTSLALLATMLWTSAQAADSLFLLPSQKARVCTELRQVMFDLIAENERSEDQNTRERNIDDVLVLILITIVVSGGDCKTDCFRWWDKALRLARSLGLNREDVGVDEEDEADTSSLACSRHSTCICRSCMAERLGLSVAEVQEENRRVFWLLFCLDRHLCLSFNSPLAILDDECQLYRPLPDAVWEETGAVGVQTTRLFGPPTVATGTGFFEYFLPLMTILGDVILLHREKSHPRFGTSRSVADNTELVERVLDDYAQSLVDLDPSSSSGQMDVSSPESFSNSVSSPSQTPRLVTAYSTFILHVLHVLLHGKWDAVSMLDNKDGWIASPGFTKCAAHSIAASDAVSRILKCDPELAFMPYLFGIYLLHGSFILLLFADRMPQVGLNESVERACETIIRAHEVCVVTLNTEFQKQFRKALRSTLNSVRRGNTSHTHVHVDEGQARRRALSLYRWSNGFTGLAV